MAAIDGHNDVWNGDNAHDQAHIHHHDAQPVVYDHYDARNLHRADAIHGHNGHQGPRAPVEPYDVIDYRNGPESPRDYGAAPHKAYGGAPPASGGAGGITWDFEAECFEKNERKNWMLSYGGRKWGVRINPVSFFGSVAVIWGFAVRPLSQCHLLVAI